MHTAQSTRRHDAAVAAFPLLIVPSLAGFLWHVLMGDLVQTVGIVLGVLALAYGIRSAATPLDQISPIRTFVPILAMYSLISIRIADTDSAELQYLCSVLAVTGFAASYLITKRRQGESLRPGVRAPERRDFLLLAFIVGSLTFAGLAVSAGGVPAFAADTNLARTQFFPNGIASTLVIMNLEAVAIAPLVARILGIGPAHGSSIAMAAMSFAELSLLGNRGLLVAPVMIVAITYLATRRARLASFAIAGFIGLIAFSYAGYERNFEAYGTSYDRDLAAEGYVGAARYLAPTLEYIAGTSETFDRSLIVLEREGLQDGSQFFSPLILSPSVDLWLKDELGLTFVGFGLAIGFVNSFYIDWGIWGTLIGPAVLGALAARTRSAAQASDRRWIVVYAYIVTRLVLSVYGHPFAYLYYLGLPILIFLILGQKRGASAR